MKIACICCRRSVDVDDSTGGNVGLIMKASKYLPVLMTDTSMSWICPACADVIIPHVQAISEAFHDEGVYWNGLKSLLKKRQDT